jgi:hypothetical protein
MQTLTEEFCNYILTTSDAEQLTGGVYSAHRVVRFRLTKLEWPLYERTRNRKLIKSGDRLLIYCGGARAGRGHIVASAVVDSIFDVRRGRRLSEESEFISGNPDYVLILKDVSEFSKPVYFRDILPKLDCCPKNMSKWGVILHGGVRRISNSDFDTIRHQSRMYVVKTFETLGACF